VCRASPTSSADNAVSRFADLRKGQQRHHVSKHGLTDASGRGRLRAGRAPGWPGTSQEPQPSGTPQTPEMFVGFVGKDTAMTTISRQQQPTKRHNDPRIGRQHTALGQTMKITTLALIATATVAVTAMTGAAVAAPGAAAEPCPASGTGPHRGPPSNRSPASTARANPTPCGSTSCRTLVTAAGRADWLASAPQAGQNLGPCRSRVPARYR
jgi:hypothetical protein